MTYYYVCCRDGNNCMVSLSIGQVSHDLPDRSKQFTGMHNIVL